MCIVGLTVCVWCTDGAHVCCGKRYCYHKCGGKGGKKTEDRHEDVVVRGVLGHLAAYSGLPGGPNEGCCYDAGGLAQVRRVPHSPPCPPRGRPLTSHW